MFFEFLGKLCFQKMRLFFFFLLLLFAPLASFFFLSFKIMQINLLQKSLSYGLEKEAKVLDEDLQKKLFFEKYSHADPYFLEKQIEAFLPLQREKKRLEMALSHPALMDSSLLEKRLMFLKKNQIIFREEKLQTKDNIKEVEESLLHQVQIDEEDLKELLSLIENTQIEGVKTPEKSPQMILKNFELKKIKTELGNELFELNMDILKREFF